jgi:superfamily I DNA/RNA helicase
MGVILDQHQQAIRDYVDDCLDSLVIEARAGSGKTFMLIELVKRFVEDSTPAYLMAFNRRNNAELIKRIKGIYRKIPSTIAVTSTYGAGWRLLRQRFSITSGDIKIDDNKYKAVIAQVMKDNDVVDSSGDEYRILRDTVNFARLTNTDRKDANAMLLMGQRHHIDGLKEIHLPMINSIIDAGAKLTEEKQIIDYTDMIYMPIHFGIYPGIGEIKKKAFRLKRYAVVMIDELQDLNWSQFEIAKRFLDPADDQQFIGVGDRYQAMYAWAGAGSNMMQSITKKLDADTKELPVCRRCAKAVVKEAQKIVPGIQAMPSATEGHVGLISEGEFYAQVKPGDGVICRFVAPLVNIAYKLIKSGKKACVRGKDPFRDIMPVLKQLEKKNIAYANFVAQVEKWKQDKLDKAKKDEVELSPHSLQKMETIVSALVMLYKAVDASSVTQLIQNISNLFSEDDPGIDLMTIHSAKGFEWDTVWAIGYQALPYTYEDQSQESKEQERNAKYVLATRAISNLNIVTTSPTVAKVKPQISIPVAIPEVFRINWEVDDRQTIEQKIKDQKVVRQRQVGIMEALDWQTKALKRLEQEKPLSIIEKLKEGIPND